MSELAGPQVSGPVVAAGGRNGSKLQQNPRVGERIGLAQVAEAHDRLERGGLVGKVVLVPNG